MNGVHVRACVVLFFVCFVVCLFVCYFSYVAFCFALVSYGLIVQKVFSHQLANGTFISYVCEKLLVDFLSV